jgi:hypothetical protein
MQAAGNEECRSPRPPSHERKYTSLNIRSIAKRATMLLSRYQHHGDTAIRIHNSES